MPKRESQRRAARHEAMFREANEGIEAGLWPEQLDDTVRFRCECARVDCNQAVEMTAMDYERVRQDPRRFILCAGHDDPAVERVVESIDGYVIVEKLGEAGELAAALDPRD
jgi:hypothetical protein